MATPPPPPQEQSEVEETILSQQCYWHCWCVPLIVPFPLHCPAEQNQLKRHILCYCKSLFVLNNSWNWLDWLLDKQDERGVARGVLGMYPHTTQEQPVSYLLQSVRKKTAIRSSYTPQFSQKLLLGLFQLQGISYV